MLILSFEKDKALVPLILANKLAVIDLINQNISEIHFDFLGRVMVELYIFKESSLVCINEQTYVL